jgi:fructose-1,6-bisphosphatase/sedoheptulose 1,7-bisphosphatase-like protein
MFCVARVPYSHVQDLRNEKKLKEWLGEDLGHDFVRALKGEWEFDLAISAADGLRTLLHGLSGPVLSVIAGGPSGVFDGSLKEATDQEYLVITVKSEDANTGQLLPSNLGTPSKSAKGFLDTLADIKLIDKLIAGTQRHPAHLTIATHTDNSHEYPVVAPVLSHYARVSVLTGSAFAAGASPFFDRTGIDAAVLVVKPVHVILIAAAAAATGNDFYAFPLAQDRGGGIPQVQPDTPVHHAQDLIEKDVFVVMTGISDNLILDGIRYTHNGFAKTQSLCIRSGTYSQRYIEQQHNLQLKRFHHFEPSGWLSYPQLLGQYFSKMRQNETD